MSKKKLKEIVAELEKKLRCNCDLDRWEPERNTGHSWVCRIHKEAEKKMREHPKKGFTIIEVLIVILIISILVALLYPAIKRAKELSQEAKIQAEANNIGPIESIEQETALKGQYGLPMECRVISNLGNYWFILEIEVPQTNVLGEVTEEEAHKKIILYQVGNNFIELSD